MAPALFTDTTPEMRINREEIFGPVAAVIRVKNYDEALAVANDTPYGLSAGIVTTSLKYASHFKRNSTSGLVMVNLPTAGLDYHVPFGGRKKSSYGPREQGTLREGVLHDRQDGVRGAVAGPLAGRGAVTALSKRAPSAANAGVGPVQRELVDRLEQRDVGAQRRERRETATRARARAPASRASAAGLAAFTCHVAPVGGNRFEVAEPRQHGRRRLRAPARAAPDSRPRHRRRARGSRESTPAARRTSRRRRPRRG